MANDIDLIGSTFGRWLVLSAADVKFHWFCRCSCGVEKNVHYRTLRNGQSKSCGCLIRDIAAKTKIVDMVGKRVGLLTVLDRAPNDREWVRWRAVCDCGTETVVRAVNLRSGNTNSCGCARVTKTVVAPEHVRRARLDRANKKYREDAAFNIRAKMANAIRISLRKKSSKKVGRWESLVGYTVDDLRQHLLSTLPAGATWDDFLAGKMEIDHRVPLSAFNYQSESDLDFRRAWAMKNLQLLWTKDNQSKSDSLCEPFQPSLAF